MLKVCNANKVSNRGNNTAMKATPKGLLRKWGMQWWWMIPLWIAFATLAFLCTFFGSTLFTTKAASPNFSNTGSWSMYLNGLSHSGYNSFETTINTTTAANLKLHWTYHTGGSIATQPVVVNSTVYWGAWDGYEYAADLNGNLLWKVFLGVTTDTTHGCHPTSAGVSSIPAFASVKINGTATPMIFLGGGDANFYGLNATTGAVIWKTSLGTPPATFLWSSPAVYGLSVYMGVSSFGDCPLIQGRLVKMNLATGTIQSTFNNVPDGCIGGAVWSSPAIDTSTGHVYIATGTIHPQCATPETNTLSMIELRASDLSLVGSWQLPPSDWIGDSTDFGASPTLFRATIGGVLHYLVGAANKNGKFYAFERGNISAGPIWEDQIASGGQCPQCGQGAISSAGFDGVSLYIAGGEITMNGTSCQGTVQKVDPATGAYIWQQCLNDGPVLAPVTLIPGVAVVAAGKDVLMISTKTGQTLATLSDTRGNSRYFGGASVSNGVLYIGNMDWNLYAYGL